MGVLLYLPPTLRGYEVQAQGLVRHAVTVSAALNSARPGAVTVVTPHWARELVAEALARLADPSDLPVLVVSPRLRSPAELVTRVLLRSAGRATKANRVSSGRLRRLGPPLGRLVGFALSSWVATILAICVLTAVTAVLVGGIRYLGNALVHATGEAAPWATGIAAAVAVAIGIAWLGLLATRSRRVASRFQFFLRGAVSARRRLRVTRLNLVMVLERADVASLVRRANRMSITRWWLPIGMYSGLAKLSGRRITTFADFSPREFPGMILGNPVLAKRGEEMTRALEASDVIVCLSDHVAARHLPALLPQPTGQVMVIPPGPPNRHGSTSGNTRLGPTALTDRLKKDYPMSRATIMDWWSMPTIVVPTQNRPYKNLPTLVRAIHILNVERFARVRAIFTCRPEHSGIGDLVSDLGCHAFVEFLPNLPDETLDLVLAQASLAISPSLFEGSLPYTFYEAMSLGTPCLLADIPVTRAATSGHDAFRQASVFDPHDPLRVADAIQRALADLDGLRDLQASFLADYYREHSWLRTAGRYWQALDGTVG